MSPGPALVWGRAAVVGTVGLASGVVAHLLGGGRLPGVAALAVLLAVSVALSACFLLSWAGPARLVLVVVAAQTGWHVVLSLLAGHAGDQARSAAPAPVVADLPAQHTGSMYDAYLATLPSRTAPAGDDVLAHQMDHLADQGLLMVIAHLLGAVALGLFLAVGERCLWRLLLMALVRAGDALVGPRGLGAAVVPVLAPSRRPRTAPALRTSQVLARSTLHRRGPPVLLAA